MVKGVYFDRYGDAHYSEDGSASGVYGNFIVENVIYCGRCGCKIVTEKPTPLSDEHRCETCKKLEPIDKKLDEIIKLLKGLKNE